MEETITLRKSFYRILVRDSFELQALEAAGVDNWSGRDEVDWPTDEEIDEEVEKAILSPIL